MTRPTPTDLALLELLGYAPAWRPAPVGEGWAWVWSSPAAQREAARLRVHVPHPQPIPGKGHPIYPVGLPRLASVRSFAPRLKELAAGLGVPLNPQESQLELAGRVLARAGAAGAAQPDAELGAEG